MNGGPHATKASSVTPTYVIIAALLFFAFASFSSVNAQSITNQPPVVSVGNIQVSGHNVSISCSVQAVAPGAGIREVDWNWGDGITTTGSCPQSHYYSYQSTFQVTISAQDSQGNIGAAVVSLNVFPSASGAQILSMPPEIAVDTPSVQSDGSTVTVNGFDKAQSSSATITAISWNWGDGNTSIGNFPQVHSYSGSGQHIITVTIQDSNGNSNQVRVSTYTYISGVTTPNPNPLIQIGTPTIHNLQVSLSGSIVPKAPGASINWARSNIDWNDGTVTSFAQYSHNYSQYKSYTIKLTVYDTLNDVSTLSLPIVLVPTGGGSNSSPQTAPSISFTPIISGLTVTIRGSANPNSQVSGATISNLLIDWNDGNVTNGFTEYTHTYADSGTFNIKVTAIDNFGNRASLIDPVTVYPSAGGSGGGSTSSTPGGGGCGSIPSVSLNQPSVIGPLSVRISGTISAGVVGGTIIWGDGTSSSLAQYTHNYSRIGTYRINVTVRDVCNNAGYGYTSITLQGSNGSGTGASNSAPSISINPPTVNGYNVTVGGSLYPTASGASIDYGASTINWGDNSTSSVSNYRHTYSRQGVYSIRVTAVDTNNNQNSATTSVSVPQGSVSGSTSSGGSNNQCSGSPTISLNQPTVTGPLSVKIGGNVGPSVTSGTVHWGDNSSSSLTQYTHTYTFPGSYTINVTVYNGCGNSRSSQTFVTVTGSSQTNSTNSNSRSSPPSLSINPPSISGLKVIVSGNANPTAPGASIDWANSIIRWGDNTTTAAGMYQHTYAVAGNYTITLVVKDTYGNVNSASVSVHVSSVNIQCGQPGVFCT